MLLQSAKLSLAIRAEYARLKKDQGARFYTYVLQLQGNRFYVGNTDNIYARLLEHLLMTQSSSLWVRHHGPISRVVEVCRNSAKADEHYKTLQYMDMYGWENVRGSSYCRVEMSSAPLALGVFVRDREGEFEYLTRSEIDSVLQSVHELKTSAS